MPPSLDETKNRLRQDFLGRAGIHGLGVSRAEQAIRVYVDAQPAPDQPEVVELLREAAKPFPILVVAEERPRMT